VILISNRDLSLGHFWRAEVGQSWRAATRVGNAALHVARDADVSARRRPQRTVCGGRGGLYLLAAGSHVFTGCTVVEICAQHLHAAPERVSQRLEQPLRRDLEALVPRCLEKTPAHRSPSARELDRLLAACDRTGEWTEAAANEWWRHIERWSAQEVRRPLLRESSIG
jgi:hypothetical protein